VRNQATTEEISVGRLREIEGGPRPSRTENRRPNGGRRPALGTRLSTAVTRGVAAWPRDRNASHIASARDPATPEFGAKAKTLDPEPQRSEARGARLQGSGPGLGISVEKGSSNGLREPILEATAGEGGIAPRQRERQDRRMADVRDSVPQRHDGRQNLSHVRGPQDEIR